VASNLPTGTVTLMFTDIAGSTAMLQELGRERYVRALTDHRRLLREAFTSHEGVEVEMQGDSFFFAFAFARDAVAAAAAGQRALEAHEWESEPIRVRVGLHTGEPMEVDGLYAGLDVHRAARVMSVGHGGQVLLSERTADLVDGELPDGVEVHDVGEHRLKDLSRPQRLYQLVIDGLPSDFPPPSSLSNLRTNLPVVATRFVGRDAEIREVRELLRRDEVRLVTLTGPGGVGKTRLGLHVAAELAADFADGVFFVPLAPVADPSLVVPTVAKTLDVHEQPHVALIESVGSFLRDRRMLLLIDNLEHLLAAASAFGELLASTRQPKLLVTSRSTLHLSGEHTYPVPPLAVPENGTGDFARSDAMQLFAERAQAASPQFAITAENAPVVAELCRRVDGLPLAIELAAARMNVLPPPALLRRLDQRLSVLTGGPVDADERQRTVRATIEWSYELLTPAEQTLFMRLSVFRGGCRIEAAEAACDAAADLGIDVLDGLTSLVEKSLARQRTDTDGEPRFWLLETTREFGAEQLASSDAEASRMRDAHADFFLELAERNVAPSPESWDALDRDLANLRMALDWLHETGRREALVRLAGSLGKFWVGRGYLAEGRGWLDRAVEDQSDVEADLLAAAYPWAFWIACYQGDYARARSLATQHLRAAEAGGDATAIADWLVRLGAVAKAEGDLDEAYDLTSRAVELTRTEAEETPTRVAGVINNLADTLMARGDYKEAVRLTEEALEIYQRAGDTFACAVSLANLAWIAMLDEQYDVARNYSAEGLVGAQALGYREGIALCLDVVTAVALSEGDARSAARVFASADAIRESVGLTGAMYEQEVRERLQSELRQRLDPELLEAEWQAGRALTIEQSIDEALTLVE
jgi:predicted ATPase/class 3 adenylate cyclase